MVRRVGVSERPIGRHDPAVGKNFIDKEAMHGLFRLFDYGAPKGAGKMPEIIRDFFGLFSVNNNDMDYFMIAKKK